MAVELTVKELAELAVDEQLLVMERFLKNEQECKGVHPGHVQQV